MSEPKKILVHICCAPCAAPSAERLLLDGHEVGFYFSNSNIHPEQEYRKRLDAARKLAGILDVIIEEDEYDHEQWLKHIQGLENEPEKGARCAKCFEYSLRRTAEMADRYGYDAFCTTLTLSPHKVSRTIFEIGADFPRFEPIDFKKKNGFLRSIQLSKEYDLYRQSYCGCEFSQRRNA
ncbi:MAG: epoxyqueuosine reductase QueH [Kiritimatiellales bacterium]|nr:epoxyqueuosine reductase QueH [Kiritimatiellales bacterium]